MIHISKIAETGAAALSEREMSPSGEWTRFVRYWLSELLPPSLDDMIALTELVRHRADTAV